MLACARHEGAMRYLVEGVSQRAQLAGVVERAREAGQPAPHAEAKLAGPPRPESLEYLWGWWRELDRARTFSPINGAPESLTYLQIDAWARLTDRAPEPYEVEALFQVDAAFREGLATGQPPDPAPEVM